MIPAQNQVSITTEHERQEPKDGEGACSLHSSYGHIEMMANAVAEGAREAGAEVDIKRVQELVPEEVARKSHYKLDQPAPIAKPDDLPDYDAIIVGTGTRYGRMSSQMANFWDQTGGLWVKGALVGKVGAAFTSTCDTARRPRDDAVLNHHEPDAPGADHRRASLFVSGTDAVG